MSSPDKVLELKTKVQTYESELKDAFKQFSEMVESAHNNQDKSKLQAINERQNILYEMMIKSLNAYRDYTKELEFLIPRN